MALVKETVSSLINGVSQQPAAVRLESQAEEQENFISDVVDGVRTRPGAQYVQQMYPERADGSNEVDLTVPNPQGYIRVFPTDFFMSGVDADVAKMIPVTAKDGRDYMIVLSDVGQINVYDVETGEAQPVFYKTGTEMVSNNPNSTPKYLDTTTFGGRGPREDLSVVTVGNALFFANKRIKTRMDYENLSQEVSNEALVWIRQGVPGQLYEISLTDHEIPYFVQNGQVDEYTDLRDQLNYDNNVLVPGADWVVDNLAGLGMPINKDPANDTVNADMNPDAENEITPFASCCPPENAGPGGDVGQAIEPAAILTALLGASNADQSYIYSTSTDGNSLKSGTPGEENPSANTSNEGNWVSNKAQPKNLRPFNKGALTCAVAFKPAYIGPGAWFGTKLGDQPVGLISIRNTLLNDPNKEQFEKLRFIDTSDGSILSVAHRQVANLDLLPYSGAPADFKIKVDGDTGARDDDFYVRYDGETWTETVGSNLPYSFDLNTMPHVLERQPDDADEYAGCWIFGQGDWAERDAGDDISCPLPSFVDKEIVSMAVHKNRLVFATETTFVFSETGELKNFFATTARNVLDTDPIDLEVSNAGAERATKTEFLLSLDQALVGFGQNAQVVLEGGGVDKNFTPATVGADIASYYEMSAKTDPVLVGGKAFFLSDTGSKFAAAYEYGPGDSKAMRGQDISIHVPEYIPAGADLFVASSDSHMMVVGSPSDRRKLTCYRQYYTGEQKVQSSWFNLTFDADILDATFFGDDLYVLFYQRPDMGWRPDGDEAFYMEKIQLGQGEGVDPDLGFAPKIDHARTHTPDASLSPEYVVNDGGTWMDIPGGFLPDPNGVVLAKFPVGDQTYQSVTYDPTRVGNRILVVGNLLDENGEFRPGTELITGSTYESRYKLSHLYLKETTNETGATIPVTTGRLQLKGIRAGLKETGGLTVEVAPQGRDGFIHEYSPRLADLSAVTSELAVTPEDFFDFFVGSNAQTTDISFVNRRVTPSTLFSYEWTCNYRDRKTGRG